MDDNLAEVVLDTGIEADVVMEEEGRLTESFGITQEGLIAELEDVEEDGGGRFAGKLVDNNTSFFFLTFLEEEDDEL